MVPELPRAPSTAPRARTDQADSVVRGPSVSSAATAARAVSSRLVPVSPSGTGKTLRSSSRPRDSDRTSTAVRCHSPTAPSSSASTTGGGYPWNPTGPAIARGGAPLPPPPEGAGGGIARDRLDSSAVLLWVLPCPAVCETILWE